METCVKCGKPLGEHFITAYGEKRCADCYDDYLMTDKGKVEYIIGIVRGDFPMDHFDADFLGWATSCWRKYWEQIQLPISEIKNIESKAEAFGIL